MTGLFLVVYQLLFVCFGSGYLLIRLLRGRPVPGIQERLARYPEALLSRLSALERPIWIHLVSLGEVVAAGPLIQALQEKLPQKSWVISTVTPTGREIAQSLVRSGKDELIYLPWDLAPIVGRAVRSIQPGLFLSFETELWPVLFKRLSKESVPIAVVNGRISPSAYRRYLWIRFFMERVLEPVSAVLTQSPQDAQRFAAIGAAKDRIAVSGNIKWDLVEPDSSNGASRSSQPWLKLSEKSLLWTAGSTHPGEERMVLEAYRQLREKHPNLRLLLAPRHPERVAQVTSEVSRAGYKPLRRSSLTRSQPVDADTVIVLDTLGELFDIYSVSDVVFVGGSLVPHGGHNLVEPAATRRAIVTGPHLHNFQAISESLQQAGGIVVVPTAQQLTDQLQRLLADANLRHQLGERAFTTIKEHRGATERTAEWILNQWGKSL